MLTGCLRHTVRSLRTRGVFVCFDLFFLHRISIVKSGTMLVYKSQRGMERRLSAKGEHWESADEPGPVPSTLMMAYSRLWFQFQELLTPSQRGHINIHTCKINIQNNRYLNHQLSVCSTTFSSHTMSLALHMLSTFSSPFREIMYMVCGLERA